MMVYLDEVNFLLSSGVLDVTECSLEGSAVTEIHKVPTPEVLLVGNRLVHVGIALTIHVLVVVGGELMHCTLSANEQGQSSVSEQLVVLVLFLLDVGESDCSVPRLHGCWGPFEPTTPRILGSEDCIAD